MKTDFKDTTGIRILPNIKKGEHFWATIDGKLVMMMKDKEGAYYVCGPWECGIHVATFVFIEKVAYPKGYKASTLYYK